MDERTRRLLERGREHYAANDYEKAARCLSQVMRTKHKFADVYHMLGVIYAHRGLTKRSQALFEEALRLNPGYTEAAVHLALSYNDQGRYEEARKVHQKMLAARKRGASASPVDPYIRGKLANKHAEIALAYEQAGLLAEAIRERERALTLCPSFVDIRSALAGTYRALGDLPSAIREFERVKKENRRLVGPRVQLGMTYLAAGRRADAAREWNEVLELQPDNRFARLYLALTNKEPLRARTRR